MESTSSLLSEARVGEPEVGLVVLVEDLRLLLEDAADVKVVNPRWEKLVADLGEGLEGQGRAPGAWSWPS